MDTSLSSIMQHVRSFLWRHHLVVFVAIAFGGIALAMYSLVAVINSSNNTAGFDTSGKVIFDKATIDKVNELGNDSKGKFTLPTGVRTDPFAE